MFEIHKGQIYFAALNSNSENVQNGLRPVLIVQNDVGNKYAPTVIVCPLTTVFKKLQQPTHVYLTSKECGGTLQSSIVLCEQIQTINKAQLQDYIVTITNRDTLRQIDKALQCSLALND